MDMHICAHCHETKPAEEFSPNRRSKTGLYSYCKPCNNEKGRKSYYRHHDKNKAKKNAAGKAKRQAKDPGFLEKRRSLQRKRRQENPGEDAAIAKEYRQRHPDRIEAARRIKWANMTPEEHEQERERLRQYKANNPERVRTVHMTWRHENPEKIAVTSARRRAKKKAAPCNDLTAEQWETVLQAFDYCCAYCHKKKKPLTQDHITPIALGGSHTLWNVVPACKSCNSKKGTKPPPKPVQPLLL